ncbi:hypothetical protein EJ05DRAFT_8110 [Pseudovirgaria hyperparasitica]|uniref:DUF8212 domain-containing protein n=1 Tax=Pseudovirgaria hyperparasitica TaxID=470096 RepID=A0A6A6WKC6_9PEZI|nr:uncharacterized protein EJ05DRAFT_8110 [Pseudovirgaria hyperparasitica]KAF2762624.1 hypothetical protein EJ05DRAFT_8110 [Pseudovirgaria hyperparasitica]
MLRDPEDLNRPDSDHSALWTAFRGSRWFTRVWTLQELLAPPAIVFYSSGWVELGMRSTLQVQTKQVTGTDKSLLIHRELITTMEVASGKRSIAQRMSWAAHRKISRIEDRAYSLMGIFQIQMPLLYGEGDQAFIRLQEEIMLVSNDHSIFTWGLSSRTPITEPSQAMVPSFLANTPTLFAESGDIISDELSPAMHPHSSDKQRILLKTFVVATSVAVGGMGGWILPSQRIVLAFRECNDLTNLIAFVSYFSGDTQQYCRHSRQFRRISRDSPQLHDPCSI